MLTTFNVEAAKLDETIQSQGIIFSNDQKIDTKNSIEEKASTILNLLENEKYFPKMDRRHPFNEVDSIVFTTLLYAPQSFTPTLLKDPTKSITLKEFCEKILNITKEAKQEIASKQKTIDDYKNLYANDKYILGTFLTTQADYSEELYKKIFEMAKKIKNCPRYKNVTIGDFRGVRQTLDKKGQGIQFAAATFTLENGNKVVAFRGTDKSLEGWREDAEFATNITKAENLASDYLKAICEQNKNIKIYVTGHSKGGRMALFAAEKIFEEGKSSSQIEKIINLDGPGFSINAITNGDKTKKIKFLEAYEKMKNKISYIIPEESIVGRMFSTSSFTGNNISIIQSTSILVMQHDTASWIINPDFAKKEINNKFLNVKTSYEELEGRAKLIHKHYVNLEKFIPFEDIAECIDPIFEIAAEKNLDLNDFYDPVAFAARVLTDSLDEDASIGDIIKTFVGFHHFDFKDTLKIAKVTSGVLKLAAKYYWHYYNEINKDIIEGLGADAGDAEKISKKLEKIDKEAEKYKQADALGDKINAIIRVTFAGAKMTTTVGERLIKYFDISPTKWIDNVVDKMF